MRLFSGPCKELFAPSLGFVGGYPSRLPPSNVPSPTRRTWAPLSVVGALAAGLAVLALVPHQPQDRADREQLLQQAHAGNARAQLQLGLAYHDGRFGLSRDSQAAATWITRAAQAGSTQAATRLGELYASGDGVNADESAALSWWQRAASAGNVRAESELGQALMGRASTDTQRDSARRWLERAAGAGDRSARQALGVDATQTGLAALTAGGPAVTATDQIAEGVYNFLGRTSPASQSIEALKQRAINGDSVAQYQLAMRYRDGAWGVDADPKLALSWLRQASERGNPVAMTTLADAYEQGSLGLAPDAALADHWRQRAAQDASNR